MPAYQDAGNGIDDDGDGLIDEMQGHGTWVSGLILGVAPDATIMALRVMDDEGYTTTFQVVKAMHFAMDHGAKVINLSLSSLEDLRLMKKAASRANDLDVIVVAAAGNQASTRPEYPAGTNHVFGVTATTLDGVRVPFSNVGQHVLVSAPGIDLVGPIAGGQSGSYGSANGTSGAAPLVAGVAALAIAQGHILHISDMRSMLKKTALDIEDLNPGIEDEVGVGLLDIAAAAQWTGSCYADINDDGLIDAADFVEYLALYMQGSLDADFAEPRGVVDSVDLIFFFDTFAQGSPD